MKLLKLQVENAFSFGKITINFSKLNPHTQIIGINLDEDNSGSASNGAGKTSIFLCLTECLFGKNIKNCRKDDIPNNNVNEGYNIEVTFSVDELEYKVVNSRDARGKAKLTLYRNSVDISEHTIPNTYKLIQKLLGMDYNLFCKLVYQSSSNYLDFLTITDAERKKLLINLFNLNDQSDVILLAKDKLSTNNKVLAELYLQQNKLLTETKISIEDKIRLLDVPDNARYKSSISKIAELSNKLSTIEYDNNLIREHRKLQDYCCKFKEPDAVLEVDADILNSSRAQSAVLTSKLSKAKTELVRYNSKPTTCSLCGQLIESDFNESKVLELTKYIETLEYSIDRMSNNMKELIDKQRKYDNYTAIMREYEDKARRLDTNIASRNITSANNCIELLEVARDVVQDFECEVTRVTNYNKSAVAHNSKQDTLLSIKNAAKGKLETVNSRLKEKEEEVHVYKQLLDALQKLLVFTLENMIISLQQAVNTYINHLFSADIALTINMVKDKLAFTIAKEGSVVSVGSLSTGELSRVQVSVLLAIRDVLTSMSGTNVNILILDEILSSLDEPGRTSLYNLLETVSYKVLSISHSYKDNRLDNLVITKKEGVSTIWQ